MLAESRYEQLKASIQGPFGEPEDRGSAGFYRIQGIRFEACKALLLCNSAGLLVGAKGALEGLHPLQATE